ncbi:MAG: thiolase family protein [Deltaproteobacteria bacterium]|nr:thiolase family protein [Deltaproteobacteria bacterium]
MDERDAIIVSAVRTPIGDFGGALRDVLHTQLAARVLDEVCKRANFPKDDIDEVFWGMVMPRSDENGMARAAILREDQDEFALTSQMRTKKALAEQRFKEEIVPVVISGRNGKPDIIIDQDEHPRPQTTLEKLSKLPPAFKQGGTVTAGNASGMNDGASAVLVVSRAMADKIGAKLRYRVAGSVAVGVDPKIMGIGPIPAVQKLLKKTGYRLEDIQLIEINEAFAAPSVAVERELGLNRDICQCKRKWNRVESPKPLIIGNRSPVLALGHFS